jgi:hypothetical protein
VEDNVTVNVLWIGPFIAFVEISDPELFKPILKSLYNLSYTINLLILILQLPKQKICIQYLSPG